MKYLIILTLVSFSLLSLSCDETQDFFDNGPGGGTDPLVDQEIAGAQDYDLTTPVFGMQVAIRGDVGRGANGILDLLDNRAAGFLDCQFEEGSQLGFEDVMLGNGDTVPPPSPHSECL